MLRANGLTIANTMRNFKRTWNCTKQKCVRKNVYRLRVLLSAEPDLYVVATATDGERLLEAVRRFTPDVVAMDLQMPFMDGLTCLHHIRAENLPVRVLVISAFGDAQSLRAAVDGGADDIVIYGDSRVVIDDMNGGVPAGCERWLKEGLLDENRPLPLSVSDMGQSVEPAFILQNIALAEQAMGLGGWIHAGVSPGVLADAQIVYGERIHHREAPQALADDRADAEAASVPRSSPD